jgi:hypothetical protein
MYQSYRQNSMSEEHTRTNGPAAQEDLSVTKANSPNTKFAMVTHGAEQLSTNYLIEALHIIYPLIPPKSKLEPVCCDELRRAPQTLAGTGRQTRGIDQAFS